jgi:hypothetical protein
MTGTLLFSPMTIRGVDALRLPQATTKQRSL